MKVALASSCLSWLLLLQPFSLLGKCGMRKRNSFPLSFDCFSGYEEGKSRTNDITAGGGRSLEGRDSIFHRRAIYFF